MNKHQEALDKIAEHTNNPRSMYFNLGANEPKKYLDLLQKLVDKETPKKVVIKISKTPGCDPRNFHCPTCSRKLKRDRSYQYCPRCGQKLDWGDE